MKIKKLSINNLIIFIVSASGCSLISNNPPSCDSIDSKNLIMNHISNYENIYKNESILSRRICVYNNDVKILRNHNYYDLMDNRTTYKPEYKISELPRMYVPSESELDCYRYFDIRTKEYNQIINNINEYIPIFDSEIARADANTKNEIESGLAISGDDAWQWRRLLPELKKISPFVKKDYEMHLKSKSNWILLEDASSSLEPFVLISQSESYTGDYDCNVKFSIKTNSPKLNQPIVQEYPALYFILHKKDTNTSKEISFGRIDNWQEINSL